MIPLHCLWTKSNYRTPGQFECYMTLFLCFDFVHSHAWCGCCSIVCLRFQDVQIKQVRLKLNVQGQEGGKILDVAGQGGWWVLKIGQFLWTSYVYRPLLISTAPFPLSGFKFARSFLKSLISFSFFESR